MRDSEQDDLSSIGEFEIVDLDDAEAARGGLLHGQYFSGRSRFYLALLTALGVVVLVLALLWPNISALSRPLLSGPPPVARPTPPVTHISQRTPPIVNVVTWGPITVMRAAPDYDSDMGRIFAFETRTGRVLWRSDQNIRTFGVVDGKVYEQWLDYSLHVLNVRDGSQLWQHPLPSGANVTSGANGLVFVASDATTIVAYRLSDGAFVWSHEDVGSLQQIDAGVAYTFRSGPQGHGTISAFRVADGRLVRRYSVNDDGLRALVVDQGVLYILQVNRDLVALSIPDLRQLWRRQIDKNADLARIVDGQIYFNVYEQGISNWIDVWSARDGSSLWRYHYGYVVFSDEQDGIVYVSAHSSVNALRAGDGVLLWHHETGFLDPAIQINSGSVYINSISKGVVDALNARSGKWRWSYSINYHGDAQLDVLSFIAGIEDGIVYVVSMEDYSINALRASDKVLLWSSHIAITQPR
ncbi:outer membrane protein assembly factor BamB family protein [Dictyobacter aurantiacus]|uniref:Pyrrolo-quinoline quinone repeat domain-containing protein n=1 Tax=Dictyobacter aurantiacus TaxID=1936993 RepID=A0A401ZFW7_9CHLR|nr:PQQ-binding-like beta-propeller repeat protein [Dictyobacter aurantiacus]GCE05739.1 hypothetical protein KDAU_30680 [Dictyobacter aurantiacus]